MRSATIGLALALSWLLAPAALAQPSQPSENQPREEAPLGETWSVARGSLTYRGRLAHLRVDHATRQAQLFFRADTGRVESLPDRTLSTGLLAQLELAALRARLTNWGAIGPRSSPALIKRLQLRLASRRYSVEATGVYDAQTRSAVAEFQGHQFLSTSGRANEETRKRLGVPPTGGGYQLDGQSVRGRRFAGVMWGIVHTLVSGQEPERSVVRAKVAARGERSAELLPESSGRLTAYFLHQGYRETVGRVPEATFELLTWRGQDRAQDRHVISRVYVRATPESGVALAGPLEVIGLERREPARLVVVNSAGTQARVERPEALRATNLSSDLSGNLPGATQALGGVGSIR